MGTGEDIGELLGGSADSDRLVRLTFAPGWPYVDPIREFCASFTTVATGDPTQGERISIVTQELIENAVRYCEATREITVELTLSIEDEVMEVRVENSAPEAQLVRLRQAIDRLEVGKPFDVYLAAMRRAREHGDAEGSGLGLPRVQYEGRMRVELATSSDTVTIRARGDID